MSTRTNKLKQLNLNPLSVAKYFWKKGIEIPPVNQRLTYFTYLEALKDGYLLFEEEWQAWPNGPVIESVVDQMFDKRHNLQKFFAKVEDLNNELVLNYTNKIFKKYHNAEQYLIFEKAQKKLRGILSVLLNNFAGYNDKTLAEVKKMRNCHYNHVCT